MAHAAARMSPSAAYFPADEPALAGQIDDFLAKLGESLGRAPFRASVSALVLAGGYGRGEGGVFRGADGKPRLYNDLEFYLLTRAPLRDSPAAAWCREQSARGEALLGIDVEFKVLPRSAFAAEPPTMFAHDLVAAHRVAWGDPAWAEGLPASLADPRAIPPEEPARLLFNRGSTLFASRHALEAGSERATNGFVERCHGKLKLALADAVLAAAGRHHASCLERARRVAAGGFDTPPGWEECLRWHEEGVAFKFAPTHRNPPPPELALAQARLAAAWTRVFLWLEGRRLGEEFPSPEAYAARRGRLFPATPRARNVALRLRDLRRHGEALPAWTDYPRGPLQRALALLLADLPPEARAAAAAPWLGASPDARPAALHDAYRRWWARYN
jgi:hypothetical protein